MRSAVRETGFALALLLWMIAGMSLAVTAVIHLARTDLGFAELRIREAQVDAAARGAALMAVRDFLNDRTPESGREEQVETNRRQFDYQMSGEVGVTALLLKPSGFLSLNGAGHEQLVEFFLLVGGASEELAGILADEVIAYRGQSSAVSFEMMYFEGFTQREELLTLPSMTREVYDKIKVFVQPFTKASFILANAPKRLRQLFPESDDQEAAGFVGRESATSPSEESAEASAGRNSGLLTFDSMYSRDSNGNASVLAVETAVSFDSDTFRSQIWVDQDRLRVLRVFPVERVIH